MNRRSFFARLAAALGAVTGIIGKAKATAPLLPHTNLTPERIAALRRQWDKRHRGGSLSSRAAYYATALNGGWMTVNEVRALEGRV